MVLIDLLDTELPQIFNCRKRSIGTSLVVQWLGCTLLLQRAQVLVPGQRLGMLQLRLAFHVQQLRSGTVKQILKRKKINI